MPDPNVHEICMTVVAVTTLILIGLLMWLTHRR